MHVVEPGLGQLHSLDNALHSLVLTVDETLDVRHERCKHLCVVALHGKCVDIGHTSQHAGHELLVDHLAPGFLHLDIGTSLVDEVDSLVGQETVVDEARTCTHGIVERVGSVAHVVK